jgi:hypothetical protein
MRPILAAMLAAGVLLAPAAGGATALFALLDTGELYVSTNGGGAWAPQGALPVHDAVGLEAGTSSSDLFLATRSGALYHSIDGGADWVAIGAVDASDVAAFVLSPSGTFLLLTRSGLLYSSTDGATFQTAAALTGSDWTSLARGPLGRLYALAQTGQVASSDDQGGTWSTVGAVTASNAVSIGRLNNDLFVLGETGEVYRSQDYGVTWTPVAALVSSTMGAMIGSGTGLVVSTREGEVAASPNGATWTWVGATNQLSVIALGSDTPQVTGVEGGASVPGFLARAPYPNPGTGVAGAVFSFSVPGPDRVRIELFDARGRLVAARQEEEIAGGGFHSLRWAPALPAGTYLVRYSTSTGRRAVTKWTIVR